MPAKVRRELTTEERDLIRLNADHYVLLAMAHRDAFADGQELEA
jgi:carbonic anhydrase/acetyltransferase-like protein (isoleucine patch superfamily)